jgi:hypothetical protein
MKFFLKIDTAFNSSPRALGLIIAGFMILFSGFSPRAIGATTTCTYDSLNRLTKADYGNGLAFNYTYDAAGNRLTFTATGQAATPGPTPSPTPAVTATLAQPSNNSTVTFPQKFQWTMNSNATTRVFFAKSTSPSLIVGALDSFVGSGSLTLNPQQWGQITDALGAASTYFWTVGSADDNGQTLFANWQAISDPKAKLLTPVNGAVLPSGNTTFTWDAGTGVQQYALWVGSEPNASDLYAAAEGTNRSRTLALPADGRPIYVRVWSTFNGAWQQFNSYSFTTQRAAGATVKAQMLTPANNSTLAASRVTFTWDTGTGAQKYALWVGSSVGTYDIYVFDEGTNRSRTITLPADGRTVYVRLWTMFNGTWSQYNTYTYTCHTAPEPKAKMISPADGSALALGPTTFNWEPGSGAQQYALWIGSSPGTYDLYAGGESKNLSKTVSLPADGRPVYVRLWTMFNGKWEQYNASSYTTAVSPGPAKAQMLSPSNNSILASEAVTFSWSPGREAQKYALWIGSAPGTYDLYVADQGLNYSETLNLPTDGRTIYVRLWTMFNGTWTQYNDYTYATTIATGVKARLTSPANGATLPSASTTLVWDAGTGAQEYALWIGSSAGTYDLYGASEGLRTSKTVTLPADGRRIYVRLWSKFNGMWTQYNNYTFTAFSPPSQIKAQLLSPTNGSTLPTGATTLAWNAGTGASQYALWIGSTPDSYDLYAAAEGTNRTKTVTLPSDGRPVYVRLWSMFNGVWQQYNSYAFTTSVAPGKAKAQMLTPMNESALRSNVVTFTWNPGSQAQQYALWVGSNPGSYDLYAGVEALRTSKTLTLPTDGRTIYVRLWTMFNGTWTDFNSYVYTAKSP